MHGGLPVLGFVWSRWHLGGCIASLPFGDHAYSLLRLRFAWPKWLRARYFPWLGFVRPRRCRQVHAALGSFGQTDGRRIALPRVRSAIFRVRGRHRLGSFGQDAYGAAPRRVRSAAPCCADPNAWGSLGQRTPTRSGACGQTAERSAVPPCLPPSTGRANEESQRGSRARPEHAPSRRSHDRRLQGRSAAEPFPITLRARHKLGYLHPMRAQMRFRRPRLHGCGARWRGLRNGRSQRADRG
jgi:hypothetical protein